MKRRIVLLGTLVGLVIAGILLIGYIQAKNSATEQNKQNTQTPVPKEATQSPPPQGQPGTYVEYNDQVIVNTKGTKILFFHAPWCPQCRSLESSIKSTDLPDGLTIIKVDYDSNQQLRQRYGVTLQTTLVSVDDNGKLIKKYVAYNDPVYASVKTNLID